jgi:hypothetical protein
VVLGVTARDRTGSLSCVTRTTLEAFWPEALESRITLELEAEVPDSGVSEINPAPAAPPVASERRRLGPPVASERGRLGPPVASERRRLGPPNASGRYSSKDPPTASGRYLSFETFSALLYTRIPFLESTPPSPSVETISRLLEELGFWVVDTNLITGFRGVCRQGDEDVADEMLGDS